MWKNEQQIHRMRMHKIRDFPFLMNKGDECALFGRHSHCKMKRGMAENNTDGEKNKVCYVCGGSGSVDCMVTCCLCKETTEHVFCMQKVRPVPNVWYCDECKESYFEDGNAEEFELPSRQRKRPRDFEADCSQSKYLDVLNSIANDNDEMSLENEVSGKEASPEFQKNETVEGSSNEENCYIDKKMENEVLGHMNFMKPCEECLSEIEARQRHAIDMRFNYSHHMAAAGLQPTSGSGIIQPFTLLNPDPDLSNSAISVIGWEGTFHVSAANFHACFGVQAHFSSPVSYKAVDIAKEIGADLKFDVFPRQLVWPKIFRVDPTIHKDIALYLLPSEHERSKENYVHLMEQMNLSDFALQSHVGNVELLIYSSKLLSTNSESSPKYLWGVFRKIRKRCPTRSKLEDTDKVTPDVPPGFSRRLAAEHQRNNSASGFH